MKNVLLTIGIVFGILIVAMILAVIQNILVYFLGVKVVFGLVLLGVGFYIYKYVIPEFTKFK